MIQHIPWKQWKHCKIYRESHGSLVQYDIEFERLFRCGFIRIYRAIPKERSMVWKRFFDRNAWRFKIKKNHEILNMVNQTTGKPCTKEITYTDIDIKTPIIIFIKSQSTIWHFGTHNLSCLIMV